MTLSAADDIALLRLDIISGCAAGAATHLRVAATCASVGEQVGLDYSLRCAVSRTSRPHCRLFAN